MWKYTPSIGRKVIIKQFSLSLELVQATNEKHIHLIMIDFNSTDAILEDILKNAIFPYTLLKQSGLFSKVKGLNLAVNSIKEDDALVFIFDLHLQFPNYLFDYIRKVS